MSPRQVPGEIDEHEHGTNIKFLIAHRTSVNAITMLSSLIFPFLVANDLLGSWSIGNTVLTFVAFVYAWLMLWMLQMILMALFSTIIVTTVTFSKPTKIYLQQTLQANVAAIISFELWYVHSLATGMLIYVLCIYFSIDEHEHRSWDMQPINADKILKSFAGTGVALTVINFSYLIVMPSVQYPTTIRTPWEQSNESTSTIRYLVPGVSLDLQQKV
ncbi:MAG: hypothetical protein Q9220_007576 [cf. Caloplaca sp. 1 TL-2023]